MAWKLCSALFLCARRRAARSWSANPLVAALLMLVAASLPALALWSGVESSRPLMAAFAADPETARGAASALMLAAALAGVVVGTLAPGRETLGPQLAAAPVSRTASTVGLTFVPIALGLIAAAIPASLFLAPIARAGTTAALASLACAAALGGIVAESAVACARRSVRALAFAAVAGGLVLADPLRPLAAALRGETFVRAFPLAAAAVAAWGVATVLRPDPRGSRGVVRVRARSVMSSALARYLRDPQVRAHAVAAVAFAAAGAAILRASGFDVAAAATLASITAVAGAATIPLVAPGLDARADWLWRSAPSTRLSLFARFASAALVSGAAVAAAGVAATLAVAPAGARLVLTAAVVAAVVFGCALFVGTAVAPEGGERNGQLVSLGAFAAFTGCWTFLLGRLASALGAEAGPAAALLAVASLLVTVVAAAAVHGRRAT